MRLHVAVAAVDERARQQRQADPQTPSDRAIDRIALEEQIEDPWQAARARMPRPLPHPDPQVGASRRSSNRDLGAGRRVQNIKNKNKK